LKLLTPSWAVWQH